ncbi:hypothetical protein GCM10010094_67440 [Streptomyces flaveus]|uniref:Uncharacterized protein n=1 Tax=Streptomyces flaveus TaxID=66370 RepID=A0A917RA62_9ACTN|nr:hypothetical protein GCM10010094_67440 [Streptomyces flaveus]
MTCSFDTDVAPGGNATDLNGSDNGRAPPTEPDSKEPPGHRPEGFAWSG